MTRFAFDLPVVPLQRILRIPIVLEEHRFPIPFRVTADALLSKTPFVCVVLLMAVVTPNRSLVLVKMSLVAGFALVRSMPASQWILRI